LHRFCFKENILFIDGPTASLTWEINPDSCSQKVFFNSENQHNVNSIKWILGNGEQIEGSSNFSYLYSVPNKYSPYVELADANGCKVIYELDELLIIDDGLSANFLTNSESINLGKELTYIDLSIFQNPIVQWTWELDENENRTLFNPTNQTIMYELPGTKTVTLSIIDNKGCISSITKNIQVNRDMILPNFFSPNADGINDDYYFDTSIFEDYQFMIFNRWGNTILEIKDKTVPLSWNGRNFNSGEHCSNGTYFFKFIGKLKDGSVLEKSGYISLLSE
jgi:gliding motility-associated-like protein